MEFAVNDYIGIPYAARGRTRAGLDCWGLVCLVYREQFGIELPAIDAEYDPADGNAVARLVGGPLSDDWHEVADPQPGDVVLCRVLGYPSHIGIVLDACHMLHARERHQVVVERIDSGGWKHRIAGFYRHEACMTRAGDGVQMIGRPHPLRTTRIQAVRLSGDTLLSMLRSECLYAGVPEPLITEQGHAWIDGEYIPASEWAACRPRAGQRIEYRLLPAGGGGNVLNSVLTLALVVTMALIAAPFAGYLAGSGFAGGISVAGASLSIGGAALYAAGMAGMMFAGSMLINAIAPIRPPDGGNFDAIKPKWRLQGGSNAPTPYSPIPVVLGRHRFTPPGAAEPYVETEGGETYLRMVVCWGYGPIAVSDFRIGDTPLSYFEGVQMQHLSGYAGENATAFEQLCGQDTHQEQIGIKLSTNTDIERTIATNVSLIKLNFHFPLGLWKTPTEGGSAGNVDAVKVQVSVKVKQAGYMSWDEVANTIRPMTTSLPECARLVDPALVTNGTTDEADWWLTEYGGEKTNKFGTVYIPLWCWTTISIDLTGNIILRQGCPTDTKGAEPSARLIALLKEQNARSRVGYARLVTVPVTEAIVAHVCVYGNSINEVVMALDGAITGCAVTAGSNTSINIASGTITRAHSETVIVERATKEAFDIPCAFTVASGQYDVRVRLTTSDASSGQYPSGNSAAFYRDCYWTTLTGIAPQKPIVAPTPLCMTAFRIKASNQLNATVAGVTGTVIQGCADYDITSKTWLHRQTRNPAALFRMVLERSMNPRPVSFATGMDTAQIERWHNYCGAQGFTYDAVHLQRRPLLDVLRDICAAGRASPTLVNGKWSVVIDEPKPIVVQHFTPHNSWGFEGVRTLPQIPHALRVRFFNEQRGWQYDERLVYDDGYNAGNATLIEQIELPGITNPHNVYRFARFHLAQMRLRPDIYTLNVDAEYLICTRGDRVRVTHDVPMWGVASGRIRTRIDGSTLVPDEVFEQAPGVNYTIRVRSDTGASVTRALKTVIPHSFSRPTTATYRTADGRILTAAVDVMRYQDGVMLLEGAGTNALLQSSDIGTGTWNKSRTTIGVATAGPLGAGTLKKAVAALGDGSSADHYLDQRRVVTTGIGSPICFWAILKEAEYNVAALQNFGDPTTSKNCVTVFNLTTGSVTSRSNSVDVVRLGDGVIPLSNGTYLCWHSFEMDVPDNKVFARIRIRNTAFIGDDTSGIYIGGAQLENSPAPTSYIPSGATAGTRSADSYTPGGILLQSAFGGPDAQDGDLYMIGLAGTESVDLLVQAIEPAAGHTARLRLVDYAPAVFDADEGPIPAWESQITLAPALLRNTIGTEQAPVVTAVATDDAATRQVSGGWQPGVLVSFSTQAGLPASITHVEAQICIAAPQAAWTPIPPVPLSMRSVWAPAQIGSSVTVRLRYVDSSGYTGPWSYAPETTVIGGLRLPGAVSGLAILTDDKVGVTLDWDDAPEDDVQAYEVRRKDGVRTPSDWDSAAAIKTVSLSQHRLGFPLPGEPFTVFVKAVNALGNASAVATVATVTINAPALPETPSATVIANSVTLRWPVAPGTFQVAYYEIRKGGTDWGSSALLGEALTTYFAMLETEQGAYTYRIKAFDIAGNASNERFVTVQVGSPLGYVLIQTWEGTLA